MTARDQATADGVVEPMLSVAGPGGRRRRLRVPFLAATLFFTIAPLLTVLANPPAPAALVLLLVGWAIFGAVLVVLFRFGPFGRPSAGPWLAVAVVAMTTLALAAQAGFGATNATALYFYAGVTAARLSSERVAVAAIALVAVAAAVGTMSVAEDWADGVTVGVTVATICLTVFALSALGRTNRALQAARLELADLAVAEERTAHRARPPRHARPQPVADRPQERARPAGAPDDPGRAATEIGDVERVAREALASVRDTVSGYRRRRSPWSSPGRGSRYRRPASTARSSRRPRTCRATSMPCWAGRSARASRTSCGTATPGGHESASSWTAVSARSRSRTTARAAAGSTRRATARMPPGWGWQG